MNWRQRADRFDQLSERRIIFRQSGIEREVAVDDDRGGLHRPCGEFAHGSGEIVRHVDMAVFQRGIRRDVRVGEKGNGVSVARFAEEPGMALWREGEGGTGQRSAFQKFTARELRQQNGHGPSINKLSAPFNRLNFVVMPKAKHFKAAAFVHSKLFAEPHLGFLPLLALLRQTLHEWLRETSLSGNAGGSSIQIHFILRVLLKSIHGNKFVGLA
jgi:hypothetical protein